jgi:hypothetical protein
MERAMPLYTININSVSIEEKKEENKDQQEYHVFLDKKKNLVDCVKSKINVFYRGIDIKDRAYIKITDENNDIVIKMLRFFENKNPNLIML